MSHDPSLFSIALFLLRAQGYCLDQLDLNQSLRVDDRSLAQRMSKSHLKRLRKCQREGLVTSELPGKCLSDVYETLATNRASKGRPMSMTVDQLETMADTFPEAVVLFGCRDGHLLTAAALCLRLDEETLYVFAWGHRPEYGSLSPVVAVADDIYRYCQEHGLRVLDAGTSTVDAEADAGLLRFKRGLGFSESLKVRAVKVCR
jgi:predicted N-acyltransferase